MVPIEKWDHNHNSISSSLQLVDDGQQQRTYLLAQGALTDTHHTHHIHHKQVPDCPYQLQRRIVSVSQRCWSAQCGLSLATLATDTWTSGGQNISPQSCLDGHWMWWGWWQPWHTCSSPHSSPHYSARSHELHNTRGWGTAYSLLNVQALLPIHQILCAGAVRRGVNKCSYCSWSGASGERWDMQVTRLFCKKMMQAGVEDNGILWVIAVFFSYIVLANKITFVSLPAGSSTPILLGRLKVSQLTETQREDPHRLSSCQNVSIPTDREIKPLPNLNQLLA